MLSRIRFIILFALICAGCGEESVTALKKQAQNLFADQKYGEAREALQKVLARTPSDPEALFLLGVAYRRDMIYDSALIFLKRADLYRPLDRETNIQLYEVGQAVKDWRIVIDATGILIKTGDRPEKHYYKLSEFWGRNNHPYNAYFYIKKALDIEPDKEELWFQAANLANIVDSADVALKYVDSAISRFGEKDHFLNARGLYLLYKGKYNESEAIFRSVLTRDSTNIYAKVNLGNCLTSQTARSKKIEGLAIYKSLQGKVGAEFKLDSLIAVVDSSLNPTPK